MEFLGQVDRLFGIRNGIFGEIELGFNRIFGIEFDLLKFSKLELSGIIRIKMEFLELNWS